MSKADRDALIALPIVIGIGALVALAGSQGSALVGGVPLFALAVGMAFAIQWLAFVPAFLLKTERFFDLTGGVAYLTVTITTLILAPSMDGRSLLLAALVAIWAIRLSAFLFARIQTAGKDDRFDEIKPSFVRFLNVWTIQGLWVTFTVAAALAAIASSSSKELDPFAVIGFLVWLFGFVVEAVADAQKSRFNADPANKGKFIQTGLWSRSRHPNYFGEITLWIGVALIALPALQGWQLATLISPIFVAFLLARVSGIPLLEKKADNKWGGQADYEAYKKRTPILIPRLRG